MPKLQENTNYLLAATLDVTMFSGVFLFLKTSGKIWVRYFKHIFGRLKWIIIYSLETRYILVWETTNYNDSQNLILIINTFLLCHEFLIFSRILGIVSYTFKIYSGNINVHTSFLWLLKSHIVLSQVHSLLLSVIISQTQRTPARTFPEIENGKMPQSAIELVVRFFWKAVLKCAYYFFRHLLSCEAEEWMFTLKI